VQVGKLQAKIRELQQRAKAITKQLEDLHSTNKGNSRFDALKRDLVDLRHVKQQLLVWTTPRACAVHVSAMSLRLP
jgi:hypothetical protein